MANHLVSRSLVAGLLFAAATLSGRPLSAAIINNIDNFDYIDGSPWPVVRTTVGSTTVTENGLPVTATIGGQRVTTVTAATLIIVGLDNVTGSIIPSPPSLLDYASTSGGTGNLNLYYDAAGSGLNVDFSAAAGYDGVKVVFLEFDHGGVNMPVTVTVSDGTNFATSTKSLSAPGPQSLTFHFSTFTGIGSVDLSTVDSLNFFFDAKKAHDFRLDSIETVLPEPASVIVWSLLGMVLFGASWWRRPSVAAPSPNSTQSGT